MVYIPVTATCKENLRAIKITLPVKSGNPAIFKKQWKHFENSSTIMYIVGKDMLKAFMWSMKRHCAVIILPAIWESFL